MRKWVGKCNTPSQTREMPSFKSVGANAYVGGLSRGWRVGAELATGMGLRRDLTRGHCSREQF